MSTRYYIIEDNEIDQYMFKCVLNKNGVASSSIQVFNNGREGCTFLHRHAGDTDKLPDVIFLDINMPLVNGWDFLDEFRKLKPQLSKKNIRIYMVSSSIDKMDMQKARISKDVTGYLVKPITHNNIREIVQVSM